MKRFLLGVSVGLVIGAAGAAYAQVLARVTTNGVLLGYSVQKDGQTICSDPTAWNNFHGQGSFIVCP